MLKQDQAVAGVNKGSVNGNGKPRPSRDIVNIVAHSHVVKCQNKARSQNQNNRSRKDDLVNREGVRQLMPGETNPTFSSSPPHSSQRPRLELV